MIFSFLSAIHTSWLEYEIKPEVAIQFSLYEEKPNLTDFLNASLLLRALLSWKNSRIFLHSPLVGYRQEVQRLGFRSHPQIN